MRVDELQVEVVDIHVEATPRALLTLCQRCDTPAFPHYAVVVNGTLQVVGTRDTPTPFEVKRAFCASCYEQWLHE